MNGNFKPVNHNLDPVHIVPGRGMGYSHVSGEIHINGSDCWSSHTGNDSTGQWCMIVGVPNIILSNVFDHLGPSKGILSGTPFCN